MFAREKDPNVERAEYVIKQFYEYHRDYAYPLDRLFNIMGDDDEARQKTLAAINASDEPDHIKYAAAQLFKLHDVIAYTDDMQKQYDQMLLTLQDPKLTLECTSLIFGMYCNKAFIRHHSQNNLFARKVLSNQSSPEWRDTVTTLQKYCFAKLKRELQDLDSTKDKLKLLNLAKNEMHIFFWKEASPLFADATGTDTYRKWISDEISKLGNNNTPDANKPDLRF